MREQGLLSMNDTGEPAAVALVDGFNLYYGLRGLDDHVDPQAFLAYLWLDVRAVIERFASADGVALGEVWYFTAARKGDPPVAEPAVAAARRVHPMGHISIIFPPNRASGRVRKRATALNVRVRQLSTSDIAGAVLPGTVTAPHRSFERPSKWRWPPVDT